MTIARRRIAQLAVPLTLALAGCSSGGSDDPGTSADGSGDLQAAFCADLRDGMSLAQLVPQPIDLRGSRGSAAFFVDGAISSECPEFTDEWQATLLYEEFVAG